VSLTALPDVRPAPLLIGGDSLHRRVMLTPSMCGHNCLFLAQIADWTWQTVSTTCGTAIYRETNDQGLPAYLSFYYLRTCGSASIQSRQLTFGDELDVVTTAFNFGTESMLTLHRITRLGDAGPSVEPVTLDEFHEHRRPNCLYVEALNRWVTRSRPTSNDALVRSSPTGIVTAHLPAVPDRYSPRGTYDRARRLGTFHNPEEAYETIVDDFTVDYTIDAARDLNGVGLVFFAAFAVIVDSALLKLWTRLGRDVTSFMTRIVRDQRICYTANAENDSRLRLTLCLWRRRNEPRDEVFNVLVHDIDRDCRVLVTTLWMQSPEESHRAS